MSNSAICSSVQKEKALNLPDDEVNKQEVIIKNLTSTEQKSCPLDKLVETISKEMGEDK